MKKLLVLPVLLLVAFFSNAQPCQQSSCNLVISAHIDQDSCPLSPQMLITTNAYGILPVCATNVPTAVATVNAVTATLVSPPCLNSPMNAQSIRAVYVSLDTIPGMDSHGCGADNEIYLRSPQGTMHRLAGIRMFNQVNKYKPTFSADGTSTVSPNNVSYNLCNYMPDDGMLQNLFIAENPSSTNNGPAGTWTLYLTDLDQGLCTDTSRITEFCIYFGVQSSSFTYSWSSDSANCLSYLSSLNSSSATFTPPSGAYDCNYTVTVTANGCGCVDSASTNIHVFCSNPLSVPSVNNPDAFHVAVYNSEITFTYPSLTFPSEMIINNMDGREVAKYQLPQGSNMQHLKLPEMAKGIYVARLLTPGSQLQTSNVKFAVE